MANTSKRILIVEDAEDIRVLMSEILEDEGYEVVSAADGKQALEQLRCAADLPKLILLDLMMPNMDGYQFRSEQMLDGRLRSIPVVLMTASGDPKAEEVTASGYLRKPFKDIDAILETIAKFYV